MPVHRLEGRYNFFDLNELQINAESALFCVLSAVCQCLPPPEKVDPKAFDLKTSIYERRTNKVTLKSPHQGERGLVSHDPSRINLSWKDNNAANDFLSRLSKRDAALSALGRMNLRSMTLRNLDLGESHFEETDFAFSEILNVALTTSNLSNSNFIGANLYLCSFVFAEIQDTDFTGTTVAICNLRGTKISNSSLENVDFVSCDFGGYDGAMGADLKSVVGLTQKQLSSSYGGSNCRLPDGVNHPDHWPEATGEELQLDGE